MDGSMPHSSLAGLRWLAFVITIAGVLASSGVSRAAQSPSAPGGTYPTALLGRWEPGPEPCRLPVNYDSDSGFKITPNALQGYEHIKIPKVVEAISRTPLAWRIESIEEYGDDREPGTDLFVLDGDHLTVTDGQRSETYRKCH